MALDSVSVLTQVAWSQSVTQATGYSASSQSDTKSKIVPTPTGANRIFFNTYTLATTVTQAINMQSLTDALGVAIVATKFFGIRIENLGDLLQFEPHGTNGFVGFFGGTAPTITIKSGGTFCYASGTSFTVDATHKQLLFTNSGAVSTTFSVELVLGQ